MFRVRSRAFLLFFELFWSAITLVFDGFLAWSVVRQIEATWYPQTKGVVTASSLTVHHDDGTTYGVDVRYDYRVDGIAYHGDLYRYGYMNTSAREPHEAIVHANPVGKEIAVFYNPDDPSDAVLKTGVEAGDLFLALFLTPFNLVMVGIGYSIWNFGYRNLAALPAGGVPILRTDYGVHVRLPRINPLAAGMITALGVSFVSIFVVGIASGMDASFPLVTAAWVATLGASVAVYRRRRYRIGSGAKDLVIDLERGAVVLPQTFGRWVDVVVPFEKLVAVEVDDAIRTDSEGVASAYYATTLVYLDRQQAERRAKLAEWADQARAQSLASWLDASIKVAREQAAE
jgi:hypothetical protein